MNSSGPVIHQPPLAKRAGKPSTPEPTIVVIRDIQAALVDVVPTCGTPSTALFRCDLRTRQFGGDAVSVLVLREEPTGGERGNR